MAEKGIVAAVATAHHGARADAGDAINDAMAEIVHAAARECEEIWSRNNLSLKQKQARIAKIMDPAELRRRKLAARDRLNAG
jgi:hypothetical protein